MSTTEKKGNTGSNILGADQEYFENREKELSTVDEGFRQREKERRKELLRKAIEYKREIEIMNEEKEFSDLLLFKNMMCNIAEDIHEARINLKSRIKIAVETLEDLIDD